MFSINASDLITACFMSAPGALAVSKLIYPELQKSKYTGKDTRKVSQIIRIRKIQIRKIRIRKIRIRKNRIRNIRIEKIRISQKI